MVSAMTRRFVHFLGWCRVAGAAMLLAALIGCAPQSQGAPLAVGGVAPDFTLPNARGGSYTFARGEPTLLAFIGTHADPDAPTSDPSRSQLVFVQSMVQQYAAKGLRAILIESATTKQPQRANAEALLNFTYDWNLQIPLLADTPNRATAQTYNVETLPTTFLIGGDGTIAQRWNGSASAAQLGLSIQALFGAGPLAVSGAPTGGCTPTAAQAPFVGLGLARSLGPQVWLVDGGQPWDHAVERPVNWIVLGENAATLRVTATSDNATEEVFNASLEPLPADEAQALLANFPHDAARAFMVAAPLHLSTRGCITLRAEVFGANETTPAYRGEAIVLVE